MDRVDIKFINFSPDFKNESLINRSAKLFKDIKTKNVNGFENFGFHELALNFDSDNVKELYRFSKGIHNLNTKYLFIFCKSNDLLNFKAANTFLFKNDILADKKIQYYFINNDEPYLFQRMLKKYSNLIKNNRSSFLFIGHDKYSNQTIELINTILNILMKEYGNTQYAKRCFFIGKRELEEQLEFVRISENNRIVMPDILTPNYAFFAESNLFLLLLKGCNLLSLVEGYQTSSILCNSENIDENLAFKYGYVLHLENKSYTYNFLSSDNPIMSDTLYLQANITNLLFHKLNIFTTSFIMPEAAYTYGQFIIDNSKQIYLTHYKILNEQFDYRLTDEINIKDNIDRVGFTRISQFKNSINQGLEDIYSNVISLNCCIITLLDNSAYTLGSLISLIYWANIYQSYLNKQNPFDFEY
ncbi:glucose-6-phosphate isomerase [Mycoplasmopsis felifaucium]|uniref:Glucose-6-phosphate isomerase n=1 Tax=Mycoplasmopsis felifaucium TaxID=35768 RepID=A0ABZ2RS86_9BACT